MHESDIEAPWWTFLAKVPKGRDDPAFGPLMRVFADPTASESWGVYNHKSEGHQVVNFFENFRLDAGHNWIRWLLERLGMDAGPVSRASWSYELEVPPTYSLCDVAIGFRDGAGPGLIIIEAKRTSEKLSKGISVKDDPCHAVYLDHSQFTEVERKVQILLVSGDATRNLEPRLRASPSLVTWEELGAVQRYVLETLSGNMPEFRRALRLHHSFLGIEKHTAIEPEIVGSSQVEEAEMVEFERNIERYACYAKLREIPSVEGWLANEPGRLGLIARQNQTGSDRQYPYWRMGAGLGI